MSCQTPGLLRANSIIELRTHPARLTAQFVDECWSEAQTPAARSAAG